MVDLSTLKAGDTIVFRNGKKAHFIKLEMHKESKKPFVELNYKTLGICPKTWDVYYIDGTRIKVWDDCELGEKKRLRHR